MRNAAHQVIGVGPLTAREMDVGELCKTEMTCPDKERGQQAYGQKRKSYLQIHADIHFISTKIRQSCEMAKYAGLFYVMLTKKGCAASDAPHDKVDGKRMIT